MLLPDNYDTEGQDLFEGLSQQLKQFWIGEKTDKWCVRERERAMRERERESYERERERKREWAHFPAE